MNKYFWFIVEYMVFTIVAGNYFVGNTLGYMEEYQTSCDESFNVPNIPYIESVSKSYYFDHEDATCEKLNFLNYFMTGLTIFLISVGIFTLSRFIIDNEISIIVRRRY